MGRGARDHDDKNISAITSGLYFVTLLLTVHHSRCFLGLSGARGSGGGGAFKEERRGGGRRVELLVEGREGNGRRKSEEEGVRRERSKAYEHKGCVAALGLAAPPRPTGQHAPRPPCDSFRA